MKEQVVREISYTQKMIRMFFWISYLAIFIGGIRFFFHEYSNYIDLGWLTLMAFWVFRSLNRIMLAIWDHHKKTASIQLLVAILAFACLIYSGSQFLKV